MKEQTTKLGVIEYSFDLLYSSYWIIALALFLFRTGEGTLPLIFCIFILLFVSFYTHIYDLFGNTMGKSIDDYGNFERIFKRFAGFRNLYNIPIFICILLGIPLYSLAVIFIHSLSTAVICTWRAIKHMHAADILDAAFRQ